MTIPSQTLTTGDRLPSVGLGVWKIPRDTTAETVFKAAETGYRHFDCACDYGNEKEVGEGLRRVISEGICQREDLWVTSKLWNTYHAAEHVQPALERSLADLGLDYLDLYLVHFPIALRYVPFEKRYPPEWVYDPDDDSPCMHTVPVSYQETWQAMERIVDANLVRNIGVSNLGTALLRDVLTYAEIRPAVLQIELHPYLTQEKLIRFCDEQEIAVTGFSPLGALSYLELNMASESESVLREPCVQQAAGRVKRTPAQVVLRWAVQRGTSIVSKSTHPDRLAENLDLFDFALTADEMSAISGLNSNRRFNDPGVFCEEAFGTFFPIYE